MPFAFGLRRRYWGVVGLIFALLWLQGFAEFFSHISSMPVPEEENREKTDAIVVLTGGTGRVQYGYSLLVKGIAKTLFISGAGKGVKIKELAAIYGLDLNHPGLAGSGAIVTLGFEAGDTIGNARETAKWMREHHYSSLRLVTSNYHMPRSLFEFQHAMPEVRIIPEPVFPDGVEPHMWWASFNTARLTVMEYQKYLMRKSYFWLKQYVPLPSVHDRLKSEAVPHSFALPVEPAASHVPVK